MHTRPLKSLFKSNITKLALGTQLGFRSEPLTSVHDSKNSKNYDYLKLLCLYYIYLNLLVPIYFRILQVSSNQSQTGMLLESARLSMPGARNWCTDIGMQMKYRYRTIWSRTYNITYILYNSMFYLLNSQICMKCDVKIL